MPTQKRGARRKIGTIKSQSRVRSPQKRRQPSSYKAWTRTYQVLYWQRRHDKLASLSGVDFTPSDVPQADADSLIELYNATDGPNWTDNTGWLSDPVVGNWYGVTVSGGRVTKVNLSGNGSSVSGDISGWTLPSSLASLNLYHTSVSGDISGWTLPPSLVYLRLYHTSVSGDISGWTLPSSLASLYLSNTFISGDISGWTLPPSLAYLNLYYTSISGDISGWTLPPSLAYLYLNSTSVSGDISGWTLPSSLAYLYLNSTSVSGVPVFGGQAAEIIHVQDCGLSQTDVDSWLSAIYSSRGSFTSPTPDLSIGGTNAAPSGTYQDGDPPTTGKEYIFELVNDPELEGFNTWSITYTA